MTLEILVIQTANNLSHTPQDLRPLPSFYIDQYSESLFIIYLLPLKPTDMGDLIDNEGCKKNNEYTDSCQSLGQTKKVCC